MTNKESINTNSENTGEQFPYKRGRMLAGMLVVVTGLFLLLKNVGVALPHWLFTWQMFLIVLGIFIGAKHSFKRGGWWIVSLIGVVFMFDEFFDDLSIDHIFWPVIIIIAGLVMIFRPRKNWRHDEWRKHWEERFSTKNGNYSDAEDFIDSTSIFGGVKKNIISKNFKGGDIVCIFGGSEVNLMQADINGRVVIEVVQVFGGTKLIVPSNWQVLPEMIAILGGIEDKRPPYTDKILDETKVLVIKGVSIFGGIDIRSY